MSDKRKKTSNIIFTIFMTISIILTTLFGIYQKGDTPQNPMKTNTAQASKNYDDSNESGNDENHNTDTSENDRQDKNEPENDGNKQQNSSMGVAVKYTGNSNSADNSDKSNPFSKNRKSRNTTENTNIIYFTTSIIDGETYHKYQYSFTITHLIEELDVENVSVYVNKSLVPDFIGTVILKEGQNLIKIKVTYRDKNGKEIIAKKEYHVNVDTNHLTITTNLKDEVVDNPFLEFIAYAKMGEKDAALMIKVNGTKLNGNENHFSATLKPGKNEITIDAECDGYAISKKYEITFEAGDNYSIYTTLKNQTVNSESISFKAMIVNGSNKAKLSVIVNGSAIKGTDGAYTAMLKTGNNVVRLKATDTGGKAINNTYIIKYVPLANQDTEPRLTHINVSDKMEISGEKYTLNIGAEDYLGNRIYYDGITVTLNGKKIQYRWSSQYTSYLLELKNGTNILNVILTDRDGRYKDFSYSLTCTYIDEGTLIGTATIGIDAKVLHIGNLIKTKKVDIYYGDNVADVFARAMEDSGYTYTYGGTYDKGFYLETIERAGMLRGWKIDTALKNEIIEDGLQLNIDPETGNYIYDMNSLGQLDFCQGSGWVYSVNGTYKECGMSECQVIDKDVIQIRYTLAYGKDIGAYSSYSGTYGIKEKYENTY